MISGRWPSVWRAALLATAACLPWQAQASPADEAVQVLLNQAAYWRAQSDMPKADAALARVLQLDPANADALASQAQAAAQAGNPAASRAALAQLQAAHPADPRIAAIQLELTAGPLDPLALASARTLANSGKPADAVAAYHHAFRGDTPPNDIAVEFYQTLAATEGGDSAGRSGLERLVRADPQDRHAQLAYAQVLINRESTRADGMDRLAALSRQPAMAEAARAAWRDGLLWSGDDPRTQAQLAAYLARFPTDPQLDARRAAITASMPDAATQARLNAYDHLRAHRLADAEHAFTDALAANPNDVESLVMLASICRVQHREADVARFLERARQADPDRAAKLIASVALDRSAPTTRADGAAIRRAYAQIAALTRHGDVAAAEALLRRLAGPSPTAGNLSQLAAIQAQAGQLPQAEQSYHAVLRRDPRNGSALAGLAGVQAREGKLDEAQAAFAQAEAANVTGLGPAHAQLLRQQAQQAPDPAQRADLYRRAIAADPADPWLRLDAARTLAAAGDTAGAKQVMAAATDAAHPSPDQLRASIYFAESVNDNRQLLTLAARLPPAARTGPIAELALRAEASVTVEDARALGSTPAMRRWFLALAQQPDPTGARASAFAQALTRAGDKPGAREVIRTALDSSHPPLPQQCLAYAGALVAAGYPRDAQSVAEGLQADRLPVPQRAQLAQVQDGAAVVAADTLNASGKPADAYAQLAPRLASEPDNPALKLALARIYAGQAEPRRAAAIADEVLRRDPANLDAQLTAINAAVQSGDAARADQLATQAKAQFPSEPRAFVAAAAAARAGGRNLAALADLRAARALRAKQLASEASSDASDVMSPLWLPGRRYAAYLPPNTASDVSSDSQPPAGPQRLTQGGGASGATDVPTGVNPYRSGAGLTPDEPARAPVIPLDPLTADIDRSIRQVTDDLAPQMEASVSLRGRTGQGGLGQLLDLETPVEASISPAGIGRLRAVLTPTLLFAGSASNADRTFFGTNPLRQGSGAALSGGSASAYGAGVDISYAYGPVTVDVGSTPLGFRRQDVVGGLEYAPKLTDALTLRVLAERRAVTDSLLSFAGERDPRTGETWGGVTRTRLHLQLDGSAGNISYYAGAGVGLLRGELVQDNSEADAGAGFSLPVWTTQTQQVRAGLDLVYFAYERNLNGFTLGSGGYFSPQQFFAALIPVSYRQQLTPDLTYTVGASFGAQTFRAKSQNAFPDDGALQAQLNNLAAANPAVTSRLSGFTDTGPVGGANAQVDYRVTGNLHVGAKAGFDRSGNYTEGSALVYARYVFDSAL